jgi:hypothetical protein
MNLHVDRTMNDKRQIKKAPERPRPTPTPLGEAQALELTSFRLVKNATMAHFVAANEDVDAWLQRQPGFKSRWIVERNDQVVVDALLWTSVEVARDAMDRLMKELGDSPVHALIDQRTVSWTVCEVRHSVAGG